LPTKHDDDDDDDEDDKNKQAICPTFSVGKHKFNDDTNKVALNLNIYWSILFRESTEAKYDKKSYRKLSPREVSDQSFLELEMTKSNKCSSNVDEE